MSKGRNKKSKYASDPDLDLDDLDDMHQQHMQRMNQMMQNPFGGLGMSSFGFGAPQITDGRGQRGGEVARREEFRDPFADVFSHHNSMMRNMMQSMNQMQTQMSQAPSNNGQFYSSSSLMSYSSDGSGKPKVYQATTSTKQAGGVKETKKSVRDSEKGIEKMAVGRHIGDKSHVITKQRDRNTGEIEENQDLVNLDEEEIGQFEEEWRHKTSRMRNPYERPGANQRGLGYQQRPSRAPHAAIESGTETDSNNSNIGRQPHSHSRHPYNPRQYGSKRH